MDLGYLCQLDRALAALLPPFLAFMIEPVHGAYLHIATYPVLYFEKNFIETSNGSMLLIIQVLTSY